MLLKKMALTSYQVLTLSSSLTLVAVTLLFQGFCSQYVDTGDLIGTEVIVPKNIKIVVSIGLSENEGILL